ncbi:MAG: hypothetical protein V2A34_09260 [Lentisphaerota bacterium]
MCSKCETVWVRRADHINKTTVYRSVQKMVCPDCETAIATFFKTGRLEHACTNCGGTLNHCSIHDVPSAEMQAQPGSPEERAALCIKCKEIWVTHPQHVGKAAVSHKRTMICPDCDSAVQNYFTTGKFEHTCKTCGDALSSCSVCK